MSRASATEGRRLECATDVWVGDGGVAYRGSCAQYVECGTFCC